jgi:hypothetical protein
MLGNVVKNSLKAAPDDDDSSVLDRHPPDPESGTPPNLLPPSDTINGRTLS